MVQAAPDKSSPSADAALAAAPLFLRLAGRVLDALLPPQCLACGKVIEEAGALCASCWNAARFIAPPYCQACGTPFAFDPGPEALCAACVLERPVFRRARAALVYAEPTRRMVLGFKHGDRTEASPAFGRWLARAGAELFADVDLVAPVPLHWTRLFARRYNQAALLAQAVGRIAGLTVAPDLLVRRRRTPSQGTKGPVERERNVARAFVVKTARVARVRGRRVLLVDDVLTTGATASACAATLLKAGAEAVDVLTLARVVRPLS